MFKGRADSWQSVVHSFFTDSSQVFYNISQWVDMLQMVALSSDRPSQAFFKW